MSTYAKQIATELGHVAVYCRRESPLGWQSLGVAGASYGTALRILGHLVEQDGGLATVVGEVVSRIGIGRTSHLTVSRAAEAIRDFITEQPTAHSQSQLALLGGVIYELAFSLEIEGLDRLPTIIGNELLKSASTVDVVRRCFPNLTPRI